MRRFEFHEGGSGKFWEVDPTADGFTVRFGKLGAAGQTQQKMFPTPEKAKAELDKLVREKTGKGYVEVGGAPAPVAAKKAAKPAAEREAAADGWIDAGEYAVGLRDGRVVARNKAGKQLASLPKQLKDTPIVAQLEEAAEWLDAHAAECHATVEQWMLRTLPVPTGVVVAVWADPAWRAHLENTVVRPLDTDGAPAGDSGLLRGVDEKRGVGLVTLDGETVWVRAANLGIPHPILLQGGAMDELDEWRAMLAHLGLKQGLQQLFRETFPQPAQPDGTNVSEFGGGTFELLSQAHGEARKRGMRVSGGCAVCRVWEGSGPVEARYWLGEGDPMWETTTGDLYWVDARQRTLDIAAVGPVAFSEGMRMASAIYGKRQVDDADAEDV